MGKEEGSGGMVTRTADYFGQFSCLAGACPHSCCVGWEVVLDEETAVRYAAADGVLGKRLQTTMKKDEDGDYCFALDGGRCPFLNEQNLCEIHLAWGAEATSQTCREHPRFIEEYGPFREITLSASCPAANQLLLGSEEPLRFCETETEEPAEEGDSWLLWLLPIRERLIEMLQDRSIPLHRRLRQALLFAERVQSLIDAEEESQLAGLAQSDCLTEEKAVGGNMFPEAWDLLQKLEILEPGWDNLLEMARTTKVVPVSENLLERIAVYFTFRYILKTVNDGAFSGRMRFVVFSTLVIERLAAICGLSEALRRYSREIEHNEDNVDALIDVLSFAWLEPLPGE